MLFTVVRLLSYLLLVVAVSFVIPFSCGMILGETEAALSFVPPFLLVIFCVIIVLIFSKKKQVKLTPKASFFVVAFGWILSSLLGALPFVISGVIPSFTDAFFESVSGFTTTGATILTQIDTLPRCISLWRLETHWLGGMGIVGLTVALMPILGVGGFQLIKAETTGPEKGKLTPKITTTAKLLWFIYAGMTLLETILLMFAGMDFIDALGHSFSTLGTGGFSSKNGSIGEFNSPFVDWICIVFMALAGVNFSLYFQLLKGKLSSFTENTEFKAYVTILFVAIFLVAIAIYPTYGSVADAIRYAAFQVVSIITTTGYATADYINWVPAAQMVIFLLFFIGSCSGSTGGGVKVVRWSVLAKQFSNEIKKLLHPHGIFSIRLNGRAGRKDIVFSVSSFIFIYFVLVVISTFITTLCGIDLFSAFSATLSMIGNIGPAFGVFGPSENYSSLPDGIKWLYSFVMLTGRLELYTMIIFFYPKFWKK